MWLSRVDTLKTYSADAFPYFEDLPNIILFLNLCAIKNDWKGKPSYPPIYYFDLITKQNIKRFRQYRKLFINLSNELYLQVESTPILLKIHREKWKNIQHKNMFWTKK